MTHTSPQHAPATDAALRMPVAVAARAASDYQACGYAGDDDLARISEFVLLCDAADRLDQGMSVDDVRMYLTDPVTDIARDVQLWIIDGTLVGFGHLMAPKGGEECDGHLRLDIHPDHRDGLLPDLALAWAAQRLRQIAAERAQPASLRCWVREEDAWRCSFLERHGATVVRHFPTLERPLHEPVEAPEWPAGYAARPLAGADEADAWVALYNESFVDHYNHHPETPDVLRHWLTDPNYRPEMNFVAVAPDGQLVGFCWAAIYDEENARTGRNEGWIDLLGTRRGARRLGLGRALLLTGLTALRAAGVDAARLGVDADSPTGATRLYAAAGFAPIHTYLAYRKDLEDDPPR